MSLCVLVPLFYSHPTYSKVKLAENCPFFYFFQLFHYKLSVKKIGRLLQPYITGFSLIIQHFYASRLNKKTAK